MGLNLCDRSNGKPNLRQHISLLLQLTCCNFAQLQSHGDGACADTGDLTRQSTLRTECTSRPQTNIFSFHSASRKKKNSPRGAQFGTKQNFSTVQALYYKHDAFKSSREKLKTRNLAMKESFFRARSSHGTTFRVRKSVREQLFAQRSVASFTASLQSKVALGQFGNSFTSDLSGKFSSDDKTFLSAGKNRIQFFSLLSDIRNLNSSKTQICCRIASPLVVLKEVWTQTQSCKQLKHKVCTKIIHTKTRRKIPFSRRYKS